MAFEIQWTSRGFGFWYPEAMRGSQGSTESRPTGLVSSKHAMLDTIRHLASRLPPPHILLSAVNSQLRPRPSPGLLGAVDRNQSPETPMNAEPAPAPPRAVSHRAGLPVGFMVVVGILAFGSLGLEHGFNISDAIATALTFLNLLLAGCYLADRVLVLIRSKHRREALLQRKFEYGVLGLFFLMLVIYLVLPGPAFLNVIRTLHQSSSQSLLLDVVQLFLLANLLIQFLRLQQRILVKGVRPELILTGSFLVLIGAGTLLLLLPRAGAPLQKPIGFMDALFTSTSACCVTGLVVRDTGTAFSGFGQTVIMLLFQTGGLGIMTFVAFLSVSSSKSLPMSHMLAFKHIVSARTLAGLKRQVWAIVSVTLLIEVVGAICLYASLPPGADLFERMRWSLFHSISAFCNAGFALQADSLMPFQGNAGLMVTFMGLIVLGGLGFLVIPDLVGIQVTRLPLIRRMPMVRRFNQHLAARRLPIQTRLSVLVSVALLLGGFAVFWLLEGHHIMHGQSWGNRVLMAAFQSVTCRTAGFNSVPIDRLQDTTLILLMGLMVIGACPVSTGGGIKTVTFGVLLLALRAMITGRERVEVFGRTLPMKVLFAALSVFVLYVVVAVCGVFALSLFDPQMTLQSQTFEVVSALSTVGLSTGITAQLSVASKLVLCLAMFIGRIGPISLVLSMFRSGYQLNYEYPEEDLVVG